MQNKAKCKLCSDIIQSYHSTDYVICKCGEISLDGGDAMRCYATKDLANVIRIDDNGNEIIPKIVDGNNATYTSLSDKSVDDLELSSDALLDMLSDQIASYDRLPKDALYSPAMVTDMLSFMMIILAILKTKNR